MKCPNCKHSLVICPECRRVYRHGTESHCINPKCIEVNAPLDCKGCGLVVSNDLSGVLTYGMTLIPYAKETN